MSLGPEGFGEINESNANLNDFSDMVRSKSTATTTNFDDDDQGPETNKDETGKLLFPGQQLARRSSVIDAKVLQQNMKDLSDIPVKMKKKKWDDDDDSNKDSDEESSEESENAGDDEKGGDKGDLKFEDNKETDSANTYNQNSNDQNQIASGSKKQKPTNSFTAVLKQRENMIKKQQAKDDVLKKIGAAFANEMQAQKKAMEYKDNGFEYRENICMVIDQLKNRLVFEAVGRGVDEKLLTNYIDEKSIPDFELPNLVTRLI